MKQVTARDLIALRLVLILAGLALVLAGCQTDSQVERAAGQAEPAVRLALISIGVLFLAAGYAVYDFLIGIVGFLVGGVFGSLIASRVGNGDTLPLIVGFLVGGGVGAVLAPLVAALAVFAAGFLVGTTLTSGLWQSLVNTELAPWVVIAGGILGGVVMVGLYRLWVAALTAALGAALIGVVSGAHPAIWVALFIVGVAVQLGLASATGRGEQARPGYGGQSRKAGGSSPPTLGERPE